MFGLLFEFAGIFAGDIARRRSLGWHRSSAAMLPVQLEDFSSSSGTQ